MESRVVAQSDLPELRELLVEMAGQWRLLLSAIGVSMAEMDVIQLKHPYHPKLCLLEGLEQWMVSSGSPTFGKLLSALRGKVAPNLPLADRVEEFAKMKATTPTVLSEPAAHSPVPASPGSPSPGLCGQETAPHESPTSATPPPNQPVVEASSTEPATVAMKPKALLPPSSPTTACDSTTSEPEPVKEEGPSFPLLQTGELTEHQKFALVGRLRKETSKIQREFSSLVFKATDSLKDRVVLTRFKSFLLECTFLQYREGDEKDDENDLLKAKSFYDVFNVIRPFYSFFGYGLIEDIIAVFGTDDDKRRLADYEEHFNEYCKRRVYECPVGALGRTSKDEILLVAKLNKEMKKFTLEAAAEFNSTLCEIFNIPDGSLRFIGVEKGCLELHFAVLSSLESVIFPLSSHQRERLQGEGVMVLRGGTHHYNLQEEAEATSEGGSTAEEVQSEDSEVESEPVPTGDIVKATLRCDTARVVALLEQGVPVDSHTVNSVEYEMRDRTPLMWAALQGHRSTVEALLSHGAGVNLQDKDGETPLMLAASWGHTAIVESLVGRGADLNIQSKYGKTALHYAAHYGCTVTVEVLVAAGANLNITNSWGRTPLTVAASEGWTATVESLVGGGADLNIQDKNGETALIHALQRQYSDSNDTVAGKLASAELLVKAGAELSHREKGTALLFAAKEGWLPLVRLLLERGADPTVQDKDGRTPLMLAAVEGYTAIVESLVGGGADLNIQDKNGKTALIGALQMQETESDVRISGKLASAELLVKAGAELNHREKVVGWTALFFAAKAGSLPLVRLLLERGADPTVQDKQGVSAYDVAQAFGHERVMEELERCTPAASEPVSEEHQPPAPSDPASLPAVSPTTSQPAPSDPASLPAVAPPTSQPAPSDPEPPTGTQPTSPAPTSGPQQRATTRARVFAAVRILAERMQELALPGRAKKREEGRGEGPRPRQRSNRPPSQGKRQWRAGRRPKPTETTQSLNTRNTAL